MNIADSWQAAARYEASFFAAAYFGIVTWRLRRGRLIVFFQNDRYDNYKKLGLSSDATVIRYLTTFTAADSIMRCKDFMKRFITFCLITTLLILSGCGSNNDDNVSVIGGADGPTSIYLKENDDSGNYTQIDQETAKLMMELDDGHVIVDVRREDEYAKGHIPGAILIPNESIGTEQPSELPDLDQIILVYCRSGRRSKEASQKLADIGYTNVYEFGGIVDWTGEIVTD